MGRPPALRSLFDCTALYATQASPTNAIPASIPASSGRAANGGFSSTAAIPGNASDRSRNTGM
ncbi:MAG: hypothetical protein ABSF62_20990 [Bryobacteraceae bacterium]